MLRACHALYIYTKFGVDSSNHFPCTAWTDRQMHKLDTTDQPTHVTATAGMCNDIGTLFRKKYPYCFQ